MTSDEIRRFFNQKKKWSFTLEIGQGETYHTDKPHLYAHSTYEKSSVLAGRPQRVYVEQWDSWEEARKNIQEVAAELAQDKLKFKVEEFGGTTHIPVDQIVSHLPDDTDY